jgi:hypothetical protein
MIATVLSACGGAPPPPPVIAHETAGDHIARIGTVWEERTAAEGFMSPPSDLSTFRIESTATITIDPTAPSAKQTVGRTERFTMRSGQVFHCTSEATVVSSTSYAWREGEATLTLGTPSVTLQRRCDEQGYPHPEKRLEAATMQYALRGDRLVAIVPPLSKSVLLPIR